jgi:glyoxylase-like metal-dependent hydrolase (beta-lactamase superfamily II)
MAEQALDKQRPIDSPLKSVRTVWREPENPIRWAYYKLLREHDKTKKVFPVNPYAEVYRFRDNVYGIFTHSLDGMGDPWIYLVVGPERAMLVDTGFGLGDLKGLVRELIGDLPYIVVNTHCAYDHSYGNTQFDTVYCHEYEVYSLKKRMRPDIWDYLFDGKGEGIWASFDRADLVKFKEYGIVGVPDGHVFNLGGDYEVELVFLPGHSHGHAAFLDRKSRILFAGDVACVGAVGVGGGGQTDHPYRQYGTVEALYREYGKIIARMDEFDGLFPGHGPVDTGPILLASIREACGAVLRDPFCYDEKRELVRNGVKTTQYCKMIYESGYLKYNSASLYMNTVLGPEV